jgi:hypothetical protein
LQRSLTVKEDRMTGDVVKAARWLGLSLVASSVILAVGLRWPSPAPAPAQPPAAPAEESMPNHMTPERIHGGIM